MRISLLIIVLLFPFLSFTQIKVNFFFKEYDTKKSDSLYVDYLVNDKVVLGGSVDIKNGYIKLDIPSKFIANDTLIFKISSLAYHENYILIPIEKEKKEYAFGIYLIKNESTIDFGINNIRSCRKRHKNRVD